MAALQSFNEVNKRLYLLRVSFFMKLKVTNMAADLGPNTLKSIQIHYNYFKLSMITITLQLQDL